MFALMLVVRERPGVDPDVRALATAVTGTPDVSRRRSDDSTPVPHVERQRTASAVTRPAATRVIEPEVLVPRENARAFALLVSAARRGEIPSLVKAGEAVDTALAAALVPIEVPPFEIPLAIRPAGDEGL